LEYAGLNGDGPGLLYFIWPFWLPPKNGFGENGLSLLNAFEGECFSVSLIIPEGFEDALLLLYKTNPIKHNNTMAPQEAPIIKGRLIPLLFSLIEELAE
jgi:hypothetical protein